MADTLVSTDAELRNLVEKARTTTGLEKSWWLASMREIDTADKFQLAVLLLEANERDLAAAVGRLAVDEIAVIALLGSNNERR